MAVRDDLGREFSGLDALERAGKGRERRLTSVWRSMWPVLLAIGITIGLWQIVVWLHWRPEYVLPSPFSVLRRFGHDLVHGPLLGATATTMARAVVGYAIAIGVGTAIGGAVVRIPVL